MSARVYIMNSEYGKSLLRCVYNVFARWRVKKDKFSPFVYCNFLVLLSSTVFSQNINKQIVNIADENLTDYSFLSRNHYTKSKNYLKRRYRIRHWISMFIGTPCIIGLHIFSQKKHEHWTVVNIIVISQINHKICLLSR